MISLRCTELAKLAIVSRSVKRFLSETPVFLAHGSIFFVRVLSILVMALVIFVLPLAAISFEF